MISFTIIVVTMQEALNLIKTQYFSSDKFKETHFDFFYDNSELSSKILHRPSVSNV